MLYTGPLPFYTLTETERWTLLNALRAYEVASTEDAELVKSTRHRSQLQSQAADARILYAKLEIAGNLYLERES